MNEVDELIKNLGKLMGKQIKVNFCSKRNGDVSRLLADSSKAQKILNWKLRYSTLDKILKSAIEYEYRRNRMKSFFA